MKTKKKTTFTLEPDDIMSGFEGYTFLLFSSTLPSYAFVDDLNHLYNLRLTRVDDIPLNEIKWPLFIYHDTHLRLTYYLVERPSGSPSTAWPSNHKMLIVAGEKAKDTIDMIHSEFCGATEPADPTDLLAAEHYELLSGFLSSFTLTRRIDPMAPIDEQLSRKAQKEQSELDALLTDIVEYIDVHQL